MLKTGRGKLKRLLLALLVAALCPLFAYSQDVDQGAQSTTDTTTSTIEEGAASGGAPEDGASSAVQEGASSAAEEGASSAVQEGASSAVDERELRFDDEGGGAPTGEEIRPVTDFSIWDFVRMVLVLAFVVALIYGLFYLLRRVQGRPAEQSGVIDVLATQTLPGNGMVHLVKVGTQIFMLGSSEHSLRLLTEIDDKESRDEVELRVAQLPGEERRSFSDLMSAMMGSFGRGGDEREATFTEEASSEGAPASSAESRGSDGVTRGTAEARAEQEVLEYISSQRQRIRRLNS